MVQWGRAGAVHKEHTDQCGAAGSNPGGIYESGNEALTLAGARKIPGRRGVTELLPERDPTQFHGAILQLPIRRENVAGRDQDRGERNRVRTHGV